MFNPFSLIGDILFIPVVIFTLIMKGIALWHAAKKDQANWFIVLLIFQTLGILEVIYLLCFQKGADPKYRNWFKVKAPDNKQAVIKDIEPNQK